MAKTLKSTPHPGAPQLFQLGIIISPINAYLDERFWYV